MLLLLAKCKFLHIELWNIHKVILSKRLTMFFFSLRKYRLRSEFRRMVQNFYFTCYDCMDHIWTYGIFSCMINGSHVRTIDFTDSSAKIVFFYINTRENKIEDKKREPAVWSKMMTKNDTLNMLSWLLRKKKKYKINNDQYLCFKNFECVCNHFHI